jgi:NADP-dependent 3-hydroxy acid dehydrogenase YdfG
VIATDLTPPHETVRKIGPTAHALRLDVTQEEQWHSVSLKSRDVGEVDIVVNNAGYFPNRSIDELDLPTWRKTMATNLDAHFLSAKYFLPTMRKKKWGRFVGISSNMVGLAIPGMSHYIATKMGITPTSSHTYLKLVRLPSSVIAARIQCVAGTREKLEATFGFRALAASTPPDRNRIVMKSSFDAFYAMCAFLNQSLTLFQ